MLLIQSILVIFSINSCYFFCQFLLLIYLFNLSVYVTRPAIKLRMEKNISGNGKKITLGVKRNRQFLYKQTPFNYTRPRINFQDSTQVYPVLNSVATYPSIKFKLTTTYPVFNFYHSHLPRIKIFLIYSYFFRI